MIRRLEALRSQQTDEGFTIVEAVISMVILGILTTGIVTGTNLVSRLTADNRSRQIAVNLAERQLDVDRGILDPFKISGFGVGSADPSATPAVVQSVSGRDYTVSQATSLVGVDGADISCGSGKTIYYRRITVTVDWAGRLASTSPVQSDTILAPNGRINDAATGSIAVQVTGAYGLGESGVTVNITPYSGTAATLQSQPAMTNVDGCSFALGVYPGTYKVTVSRPGSVDTAQVQVPSTLVPVLAGSTAPATFAYDQSGVLPVQYAGGTATLPSNMPVTFFDPGLPYISSSTLQAPTSVSLYPYPQGYTAIAGAVTDASGVTICAAESPANWTLGTYGGKVLTTAAQSTTAAASPGGTAPTSLKVPMGTFTVRPTTSTTLTAVAQNVTTNGQPGCKAAAVSSTTPSFTFPNLPANTTSTLALPYGTYRLTSGAAVTVAPVPDQVSGLLSAYTPGSTTGTGTLTLDPRAGS
jgi:type II secretory pathway pseudopilin PulG